MSSALRFPELRLGEREALRRTDAMKTAILRAASHEFRSPLTAIRIAVETLEDSLDLPAGDQAELFTTIAVEERRLERLVHDLLDLSKIEGRASP